MRYEVFYGVGATNFLGELGGADRKGSNYLRDFEFKMTRPLVSLGFRYKIAESIAIKSALSYGMLSGSDKITSEASRRNRNLVFKSPLTELSAQIEYSIIKERVGHRYNLRRIRGVKGFKTNTYLFAGIAGFWFNPKGQTADGDWHALQPLGTEGQELIPSREKYSRVSVAIPYGIGFKYGINRKWSFGLELGMRKTFTDYIDDVSTTYYINSEIAENNGEIAAYLADPSDGENPSWTASNQQRGNSDNNDSYMFMVFNLTYKLRTTRKGLPKF